MKSARIYFFLFALLFAPSAIGQRTNSSIGFEILVYGLQSNSARLNAKHNVADRWNIHFKSIAQCLITPELKDSADIFNRKSDSLISLKYGKNWRREFEKETAKENKLIEKLVARVKTLHCISHLDSTLAKESNEVYYLVYPYSLSRKEKSYEVFVYGWGVIDGKTDMVCYYKFKGHKRKKTMELVTDKPSFLFN